MKNQIDAIVPGGNYEGDIIVASPVFPAELTPSRTIPNHVMQSFAEDPEANPLYLSGLGHFKPLPTLNAVRHVRGRKTVMVGRIDQAENPVVCVTVVRPSLAKRIGAKLLGDQAEYEWSPVPFEKSGIQL